MEKQLTIEIPELGKTLYLPTELAACDTRQYIEVCGLIYAVQHQQMPMVTFRSLCIYKLLNIKEGDRKIDKEDIDDALSNIAILGELMDSFFEESPEGLQVKLSYARNHIQTIWPKFKSYQGPKDFFTDVDFGEYKDGLNVFLEYEKTKNPGLLYRLMAIFFRNNIGDQREKYDPLTVTQRAELFSSLPIGYPYGFYYTFRAFHTYFTSSEVVWEGNIIDLSIIFTEQPDDEKDSYESPYPSLGLQSIAFQLAESGVFGSERDVDYTNLWKIALRLYDMRKRDLDYKANKPNSNSDGN